MTDMRKVTAFLPAKLLETAQEATGAGVSETLRIALQQLAHAEWSKQMLALEGKLKEEFKDFDLDALREDREFDERGNVL